MILLLLYVYKKFHAYVYINANDNNIIGMHVGIHGILCMCA